MEDYTRAKFIKAGFALEWLDGQPVLVSNLKTDDGRADYQAFRSPEHLVQWLAAGFDEIERNKVAEELAAQRSARTLYREITDG